MVEYLPSMCQPRFNSHIFPQDKQEKFLCTDPGRTPEELLTQKSNKTKTEKVLGSVKKNSLLPLPRYRKDFV